MSRPPRPHPIHTTTGAPPARQRRLDYLPAEHADFVRIARDLARDELGLVSSGADGDFAGTLMELPALVAHVLAFYQDRYASEAFLHTAESPRSLVRHGRRLAYEPDPGVAATGFLALSVPSGTKGVIPGRFAVTSVPVGEKKSQDYETLEDVPVDGRLGEMLPKKAMRPVMLGQTEVDVAAVLEIEAGEVVVFESPSAALHARWVEAAERLDGGATTRLTLDTALATDTTDAKGWRVHAGPRSRFRLFGYDASPAEFPELAVATDKEGTAYPTAAYHVSPHDEADIYLSVESEEPLAGTPVARVLPRETDQSEGPLAGTPVAVVLPRETIDAFGVERARDLAVTFRRTTETVTTVVKGWDSSNNKPIFGTQEIHVSNEISAPVTAIKIDGESRLGQDIRNSVWLAHFEITAPLVAEVPNEDAAPSPLDLEAEFPALEPGHHVVFETRREQPDGPVREVALVTSVSHLADPVTLKRFTRIGWDVVDPPGGARSWTLGDLRLRGNVARLSHGRTVDEVLGGSDGTAPFLSFPLGDSPLTHLPGADGGEPALEVRVGGVLWTRVDDFYDSGRDDLHYRLVRDENQITSVLFGNGKKGAVPPAGRKHIEARYRVGLGVDGNAGAGQVTRVKKAHPLVDDVTNPRPISGGADPAEAADVRVQATRYIRTFDRAVSVRDHADLALLFPGVARSSALLTDFGPNGPKGIRVVVADAYGDWPGTVHKVRAFLEARRDTSLPLEVVGPLPSDVQVRLYVEVDSRFLRDAVERAVRAALFGDDPPGLLAFGGRALGEPLFLSELYEVVAETRGVAFVEVKRLDLGPQDESVQAWHVRDVLKVSHRGWLRLLPENLGFVAQEVT